MDQFELADAYATLSLRREREFNSGLDRVKTRLQQTQRHMEGLARASRRMLALEGLLFGLAIRQAATFEASMSRVKALTGATASEFRKLSDEARRLGATTQYTASQSAEAMSSFAMAGFESNKILASMPATLNLAAAGQLDLGQAADITAKIMAGMQLEADDLTHTVDVLAKAFTTAQTDLGSLGEAMKMVGPVASAAEIPLEDVVSILQVLANNAYAGSMGGTALKRILSAMAKEGKEVTKVFDSLNVSLKDGNNRLRPMPDIIDDFNTALAESGRETEAMALAMSAFGQRGGAAFTALLNEGAGSLRQFQSNLKDVGGTAQRIARTQMDNLQGSFTELKSAIEAAGISLAGPFKEELRDAVKWLRDATQSLSEMDASTKESVKAWAEFGAAVAAATIAGERLLKVATSLATLKVAQTLVAGGAAAGGAVAGGAVAGLLPVGAAVAGGLVADRSKIRGRGITAGSRMVAARRTVAARNAAVGGAAVAGGAAATGGAAVAGTSGISTWAGLGALASSIGKAATGLAALAAAALLAEAALKALASDKPFSEAYGENIVNMLAGLGIGSKGGAAAGTLAGAKLGSVAGPVGGAVIGVVGGVAGAMIGEGAEAKQRETAMLDREKQRAAAIGEAEDILRLPEKVAARAKEMDMPIKKVNQETVKAAGATLSRLQKLRDDVEGMGLAKEGQSLTLAIEQLARRMDEAGIDVQDIVAKPKIERLNKAIEATTAQFDNASENVKRLMQRTREMEAADVWGLGPSQQEKEYGETRYLQALNKQVALRRVLVELETRRDKLVEQEQQREQQRERDKRERADIQERLHLTLPPGAPTAERKADIEAMQRAFGPVEKVVERINRQEQAAAREKRENEFGAQMLAKEEARAFARNFEQQQKMQAKMRALNKEFDKRLEEVAPGITMQPAVGPGGVARLSQEQLGARREASFGATAGFHSFAGLANDIQRKVFRQDSEIERLAKQRNNQLAALQADVGKLVEKAKPEPEWGP